MDFPSHYSLHSENDKHFVIHDARDGTKFNVAKKALHPAHQIKIMKMKKMSGGGETEADDASVPAAIAADSGPAQPAPVDLSVPQGAAMDPGQAGATGDWTPAPSGNTAEMPQGAGAQVGGMAAPGKTPDMLQQFQANQGMEEQGMQAKGQSLGAEGKANAQVYQNANDKIGQFMDQSNKAIDAMGAQNDALSQAVANTKIDPKAYFHNMSTGQKIGNAIALIVGGIGAGLTRGPNLALESMNKAIERDIESQKANLGNKQSLLSTNLARYKDMRAAQTATMMQMNAMAQGQIAANAAKYGGAQGQAATQAALGALKNQNLQSSMGLKQQVFQLQLQQHLAGGDVSKDNPLDYVRWVVPADKQKDVATELGKSQYAAENHQNLMNLWDKAQKEQTMMRTGFGMVDAPATRELRLLGDPLIHEADGRVNEFEKKDFEGTMPSSGQSDARQKELRDGFENFIMGKQNAPMAKSYGIDVNKFNSTKMNPIGQDIERAFTQGPYKGKIGVFGADKQFKGFK